jgi:hypothetical protein
MLQALDSIPSRNQTKRSKIITDSTPDGKQGDGGVVHE